MFRLRCIIIVVVLTTVVYFSLSTLRKHLDPNSNKPDEDNEDKRWVSTSPNWLDRQACRWIALCGLSHWRPDPATGRWTMRKLRIQASQNREDVIEANNKNQDKSIWDDISSTPEQVEFRDIGAEPKRLQNIPQYVLDHAPLVHLYSEENFWPSDITEHLVYTTPYLNYTSLNLSNQQFTPYNLHLLNKDHERGQIFMHSKNDVEERPDWLRSVYNKPTPYDMDEDDLEEATEANFNDSNGKTSKEEKKSSFATPLPGQRPTDSVSLGDSPLDANEKAELRRSKKRSSQYSNYSTNSTDQIKPGGYSNAPSILIIVNKGPDILDAFWFFFYSYNLGTTVFNIRFGNHVGDWEHALIRFHKGVPKAVFCSAHSGGLAYAWKAVEKGKGKNKEGRPILYSAFGSHAMYATPGRHPYILPLGLLADLTNRGPLWDPALNYLAYHHNTSITHDSDAQSSANDLHPSYKIYRNDTAPTEHIRTSFEPAACNPSAPVGWWWFAGRWGDKFYELRDWRQWRFFGQYHYVNGPLGPRFKNLGRAKVCQSGTSCQIVENLSEKRSWTGL